MPAHILENAQNVVINNSHLVDNSLTIQSDRNLGLRILLDASIPEASHDSSARYPPPCCHPETRKDYIEQIVNWGLDTQEVSPRGLLWLYGPAGAGKSAIAQTCVERMGEMLAAAFFFSRTNAWDDPNQFFTSIAYQLATHFEPYREHLDILIRDDPTIVTKSIQQQFQRLIVTPIQQLKSRGNDVGRKVIVIDGLDECQGNDFQRAIVNTIATSVQYQTTPFLWAFMSRPELHIAAAFTSSAVRSLCLSIELPVTRELDGELWLYLNHGLEEIRHGCGLSPQWVSEDDLQKLVDLAAGLFIYAATVLRFIGQPSPLGPEGQLRAVLALQQQHALSPCLPSELRHPLSDLDLFYTLIMQQIPQEILPLTEKILLAIAFFPRYRDHPSAVKIANILDLSESQFRNALCQHLQSVLMVVPVKLGNSVPELAVRFHHASFMEFLQDESRSGKFCIAHAVKALRRDVLRWLKKATQPNQMSLSAQKDGSKRGTDSETYINAFRCLLRLCISFPIQDDEPTLRDLSEFDFTSPRSQGQWYSVDISKLMHNIPKSYQNKIIRPFWSRSKVRNLFVGDASQMYVLGNGERRALVEVKRDGRGFTMQRFPSAMKDRLQYILRK